MTEPVKLTDDVLALLKLRVTYRDFGARERAILDAVRELRDAAVALRNGAKMNVVHLSDRVVHDSTTRVVRPEDLYRLAKVLPDAPHRDDPEVPNG